MAFIQAFGKYLPARVVNNQELATKLGVTAEWIEGACGIQERRYSGADETLIDLAVRAAEDCLSRAGVAAAQVGMVVMGSGSPYRHFPGPGLQVARKLGIQNVPVFDLALASVGALFGLTLAERFAAVQGNVLVIAAEQMAAVVQREPIDKNTSILFGDGAGACLISPSEGKAEIKDFVLYSDGAYSEDLKLEIGRPLEMNGQSVIMQAARKFPRAIGDLLERNKIAPADVDVFLLHQANQNLLDRVARTLKVPEERCFSNIRRYGNTSSASMLIAASEWEQEKGFRAGAPVVFAAFGAGFHWGAMLVTGKQN